MSGTIFDLIESEPKSGQEGFFDLAAQLPMPKEKGFISKVKGYGKSALKGGIEGLYQLGRIMGPVGLPQHEELHNLLEEKFPTENEDFGQKALRRGLKEVPTALALPGSTLGTAGRAIGAGFLGQGAEELGAPPLVQAAAELTAYLGPDVTKKLLSSGKNKELIDTGKKLGLTDEQLTPLIQGEFKQKWLSKIVPKRGSTQKALSESKLGLSNAYTSIQGSEGAARGLTEVAERGLQKQLGDQLSKMPSSVREKIKQDTLDLFKVPVTGKTLMNYYADINHLLGPNSKQLSLLKKPVQEAISSLSPELAKDFALINDLYSRYATIAGRLKPTLTSDIVSAAEALGIGGSIILGHYPTLIHVLGEKAARKVAQQMLLNPNFQQLGKKMVIAINLNKPHLARKVIEDYIKLVRKDSPDAAKKIEQLDEEELMQFFSPQ